MEIMAHISEAKHQQLINQIESILQKNSVEKIQSSELAFLKKEQELMTDIFNTYKSNLNELKRLISTYQKIQSRVRVMLRHQQLAIRDVTLDN
jgi:hypothetical protein